MNCSLPYSEIGYVTLTHFVIVFVFRHDRQTRGHKGLRVSVEDKDSLENFGRNHSLNSLISQFYTHILKTSSDKKSRWLKNEWWWERWSGGHGLMWPHFSLSGRPREQAGSCHFLRLRLHGCPHRSPKVFMTLFTHEPRSFTTSSDGLREDFHGCFLDS